MMYLFQLLAFVFLLLIGKVSSSTCKSSTGIEDYVGFKSSTDLGSSRCSPDNPEYCCICPFGKMVPPSIDSSQVFSMSGER